MDVEQKPDFTSFTPAELRELYLRDPHRFNELAAEAIRVACLGKTNEQTLKLRRIQWNIENQLRKGKTPLQKMHIMENIFYDQVFSGDGQLNRLLGKWSDFMSLCESWGHDGKTRPPLRLVKGNSSTPVS